MDHLCYLCRVFVMLSRLFIAALVVTCWERADLLTPVPFCLSYLDNKVFLVCPPVYVEITHEL